MQGDKRIIDALNAQLAREYGAIIQYTVHAATVNNWGYTKLAGYMRERAEQEMGHANILQDRILFLGGVPEVRQAPAFTAATVPEMLEQDLKGEVTARDGYNELIKLAIQLGDNGTRAVADLILGGEENHINDIEAALQEIADMKLPVFLGEML